MIRHHLLADEWRDRLLLELRDCEVPGATIGEVLAEVDAHCAATGETPQESFGDPATYAEPVATAVGARPTPDSVVALKAFLTVAGIHAVLEGTSAVAAGTSAAVRLGELTSMLLAAAGAFAILRLVIKPAPQVAVRLVFVLAVLALLPLPPLLWRRVIVTVAAWPMLLAGVIGLAVTWWELHSDLVIDPRTGREPFRRPRALAFMSWLPLVVLGVAIAVAAFVPA